MHQSDYIRLVPGGDTAVLFIHGIVGTPEHFIKLLPLVQQVPREWSVYNIILDGHCGTARDVAATSMEKWKNQVAEAFESLSRIHGRILVVGHSMGCLFALRLAMEHPQKVARLFLLAVPLRPRLGMKAVGNSLRYVWGRLREDVPVERATMIACGTEPTRKLWQYIGWIPRYMELFGLVRETCRDIEKLSVPCAAWQSAKDELVYRSSWDVLGKNRIIQRHMLENSSHFYYAPEDVSLVCNAFRGTLEREWGGN